MPRLRFVLVSCALISGHSLVGLAQQQQAAEWPVGYARFDGQSVLRVRVPDATALATVLAHTDDVWSHGAIDGQLDIRVTPAQRQALDAAGIVYEVFIADLQDRVDNERAVNLRGTSFFDTYHDFDTVVQFLDDQVAAFPNLAQKVQLGTSIQGRPLWALRITGPDTPGFKPMFLLHGGQHAREWITVAMTSFLIDHLLTGYGTDPVVTDLLNRVEWYVMPVMNPDGYVLSWDVSRMWRKNLRTNPDGTLGVDLNRNWSFAWGLDAGSSPNPIAETYRGLYAFSEPESDAVADFIRDHPAVRAYCDIHSYSEMILWPWGYTSELADNHDEYALVGNTMGSLIQDVHGHIYRRGPIFTTIYPVSGASTDWAHGREDVFAFGFELRDRGQYGFLLPPDQIVPASEEMIPALLHLADWIAPILVIDLPDGAPAITDAVDSLTFVVDVADSGEIVDPASPRLNYRPAGEATYDSIALEPIGGQRYAAHLPVGCAATVDYYIEAHSLAGRRAEFPRGAPERVLTVTNPAPLTVGGFANDLPRCLGSAAELGVPVDGYGALDYQWYRDGIPVPGATTATLAIPSVAATDWATYRIEVADGCGNVAASNDVAIFPGGTTVTSQPTGGEYCTDSIVVLTVQIDPADGATYQWFFNDQPLPGATDDELWLINLTSSDAGAYHCVIASDCVTVSSAPAVVSLPDIDITEATTSRCVTTGDRLELAITAVGQVDGIQWQRDWVNIPGATALTLVLDPVTPADAGVYRAGAYTLPEVCLAISPDIHVVVDACVTCGSSVPGDADADGDRDLADYAAMQSCRDVDGTVAPGCACLDINGDGSLDGLDYELWVGESMGPSPE